MKKLIISILALSLSIILNAQNIYFIDDNFKQKLLNHDPVIDTNGNGLISVGEAEVVLHLNIQNAGITNLTEIKYFINMETLNCSDNQLVNVDFGGVDDGDLALKELNCMNNQIENIDLSKLPYLEKLYCLDNELTYMNTSSNVNLLELFCRNNNLAYLDLSANTKLTSLYCSYNELPSLDLLNNPDLTYLHCNDNSIDVIDLSNNASLEDYFCQYNNFTSLDVTNNINLRKLWFGNNNINNIDLSANTLLEELWCPNNLIASLNLINNTNLLDLNCSFNNLTELDLDRNGDLKYLVCKNNDLSNLGLSFNTSLIRLDCSSNDLVCLDISQNTLLKELTLNYMLGLTRVCVWVEPFIPFGLIISRTGSPQIEFSADCGIDVICPEDVYVYSAPSGSSTTVNNIALDYFSYSCDIQPSINFELSGATTATGTGDASGNVFNLGKTTVTYYLNVGDDPLECSFDVYVTDPAVLSIVCPDKIEFDAIEGLEIFGLVIDFDILGNPNNFTVVDYVLSGATINQGGFFSSGSIINFNLGITYVKLIVHDQTINYWAACTFEVNVNGNPDLEIICPENVVTSNDIMECFATIYDLEPQLFGGSPDDLTLEYTLYGATEGEGDDDVSGLKFNVGRTTVLYTLSDSENNTKSRSFDIIVNDTEAPFVALANLHVDLNEFGEYLIEDYSDVAYIKDNCVDDDEIVVTQYPDVGYIITTKTTVTLNVGDGRGNVNIYIFQVIPGDNIDPVIICPSPQSEIANENCGIIIQDYRSLATVTDNYDDDPEINQNPLAGTLVFTNTIVNISATDASGNKSSCNFSVMINDTISPEIIGPGNIIDCNNVVDYTIPYAIDACSDAVVFQTDNTGLSSGSVFPDGTTVLEYAATDMAGNSSQYTFKITILPDPVVSLSPFLIDTVCYRTIPVLLPDGEPSGGTYSGSGIDGDMFNPLMAGVGTHTITYWMVDSFGCIGIDSTSITVDECSNISGAPIFIYPNPAKEYLNIVYTEGDDMGKITIIDMSGRRVWEQEINQPYYVLDVSFFKIGLYILQVELPKNGNDTKSNFVYKKFVRN